jgi:SulP family sulfate permease
MSRPSEGAPRDTGPAATTATRSVALLARHLLAALVLGAMAVALNTAAAAMVYQGPLAVFLDRAIALTLIGGVVMGLASAVFFTDRGAICQPQNTIAVVVAISAASLVSSMADPQSERSFATVAAFVAGTSVLVGAATWLLGRLRLGLVARFIPFPVLTGFLAATGYLLVAGGLGMAIGDPVRASGVGVLLEPGRPIRWIPWAFAALAIVIVGRRLRQPMAFPAGLLLAALVFYAIVGLVGTGLEGARQGGWLVGPFEGLGFLPALRGWKPVDIDGWALSTQIPNVVAIVGLSIVAAVLSASTLEGAVALQVDPDRDLRAVGVANLASGLAGGPVGYHSLPLSVLAHGFGATGPGNGLTVATACALVLAVGAPVISALPVGIFATGVMVVGLNLLIGPLLDQRRSMPVADYAVVLVIPAVTAAFGFLWGVAVGLVVATLFFVITFAHIDVVRLATTGARLRSRLERPGFEQARLAELGRLATIYSLEGYIFFGTADRLARQLGAVLDRTQRPRFALIDFRRVKGLDTSAARALVRLDVACRRADVDLIFTGLPEASAQLIQAQLALSGGPNPRIFARLEEALEMVEDRLLAADPVTAEDTPDIVEELRRRHPTVDLDSYFQPVSVPTGTEVVAQGAASDSLLVLRLGLLRTEVSVDGGAPVTLARCLPGSLVGEIGLYAGIPRTARVVAEQPSEFLRIDARDLDRMSEEQPAVLADFNRLVAGILARRLSRTTALLADAELLAG